MQTTMKKINIRKFYYHARHRYLTMNNVVVTVALIIGASWAWGSIGVMQRNYNLQKEIDAKARQEKLVDLETQNLAYEQRYYQSNEYKELAMRERLGLGMPGEKALILPPNSKKAKADTISERGVSITAQPESNLQQWVNFLFGGNHSR